MRETGSEIDCQLLLVDGIMIIPITMDVLLLEIRIQSVLSYMMSDVHIPLYDFQQQERCYEELQ